MGYLYPKIPLETITPQNFGPLLIKLSQSTFNLRFSDSNVALSYLIINSRSNNIPIINKSIQKGIIFKTASYRNNIFRSRSY